MRRNLLSLIKFALLCLVMVLLTIFLYKTFFYVQRMYDDNETGDRAVASAQIAPSHPRQGAFFMGKKKNTKHIKIDWHDYKFIEAEKLRTGIGEHGAPSHLSDAEEVNRKRLFDQNGFNALLSDKIALNRSVADIRHKEYV